MKLNQVKSTAMKFAEIKLNELKLNEELIELIKCKTCGESRIDFSLHILRVPDI